MELEKSGRTKEGRKKNGMSFRSGAMKILSCLFLSFLPVLPFLPKQYPFSTQKTELKNLQGEEPAWREKNKAARGVRGKEREMMTGLSIFLAADKLHLWKSCIPLAYVFCPLARKQFLRSEISFSFPSFSFFVGTVPAMPSSFDAGSRYKAIPVSNTIV